MPAVIVLGLFMFSAMWKLRHFRWAPNHTLTARGDKWCRRRREDSRQTETDHPLSLPPLFFLLPLLLSSCSFSREETFIPLLFSHINHKFPTSNGGARSWKKERPNSVPHGRTCSKRNAYTSTYELDRKGDEVFEPWRIHNIFQRFTFCSQYTSMIRTYSEHIVFILLRRKVDMHMTFVCNLDQTCGPERVGLFRALKGP